MQHEENFRLHYARTLAGWCRNLEENWDACVAEVGEGTARVWGLYMAGSRLAFERNEIQLHHVLATKTDDAGHDDYPLRPTFPRTRRTPPDGWALAAVTRSGSVDDRRAAADPARGAGGARRR